MDKTNTLADTQRAIIEAAERRGYERGLAESEADRKDAERYRWLKRNGRSDSDILWDHQGEELDRVIDSEIARARY